MIKPHGCSRTHQNIYLLTKEDVCVFRYGRSERFQRRMIKMQLISAKFFSCGSHLFKYYGYYKFSQKRRDNQIGLRLFIFIELLQFTFFLFCKFCLMSSKSFFCSCFFCSVFSIDLICFLCSDLAKHISGQIIGVDGNTETLYPRS